MNLKIVLRLTIFLMLLSVGPNGNSQALSFEFSSSSFEQDTINSELQAVLAHFRNDEDSYKYLAAKFLVDNIHLHYSQSYYWEDTTGVKVPFDEVKFEDFSASISAFEDLKNEHGNLRPHPVILPDRNHITAEYLIKTIDTAFDQYGNLPISNQEEFELFCEYLLSYRVSIEPLYEWRAAFRERFSKFISLDESMTLSEKILFLKENITLWFVCTYNLELRSDPIARLGSLQLLHRKKGTCEDVAALAVFALRSLGIPSTIDVVPYWATTAGGHALNTAFDSEGNPYHFDVLSYTDSLHEFIREPAKVFRLTYSQNENALANKIPFNEIPPYGMLRERNYVDVTEEYWPVRDVEVALTKDSLNGDVIYACVFNRNKWRPVWWGEAQSDSISFTNMCQGAVFLPKIFSEGKLRAVGYPVASGYDGPKVLEPLEETQTIQIREVDNHLKFKPETVYTLYYYDHKWVKIGRKIPDENTTSLFFKDVPKNALLILKPTDSDGKERPFTVSEDGQRLWW